MADGQKGERCDSEDDKNSKPTKSDLHNLLRGEDSTTTMLTQCVDLESHNWGFETVSVMMMSSSEGPEKGNSSGKEDLLTRMTLVNPHQLQVNRKDQPMLIVINQNGLTNLYHLEPMKNWLIVGRELILPMIIDISV